MTCIISKARKPQIKYFKKKIYIIIMILYPYYSLKIGLAIFRQRCILSSNLLFFKGAESSRRDARMTSEDIHEIGGAGE